MCLSNFGPVRSVLNRRPFKPQSVADHEHILEYFALFARISQKIRRMIGRHKAHFAELVKTPPQPSDGFLGLE